MRKILLIAGLALTGIFATAYGQQIPLPAKKNPGIKAVSSTKPPTLSALLLLDKLTVGAWIKGDSKFFERLLSDKFVSHKDGMRMSGVDLAKMVREYKCQMKSWSFRDPQMSMIDKNTYVVSYIGTFDGSCSGTDGSSIKLLSPVRAASIYVRDKHNWKCAFHSETLITDPPKDLNVTRRTTGSDPKRDPLKLKRHLSSTEVDLAKAHSAFWEAVNTNDRRKLDGLTTTGFSSVWSTGAWVKNRNGIFDRWAQMKCHEPTSFSIDDAVSSSISPDMELLTLKWAANGKCDGYDNSPRYQAAVYLKSGGKWKLAFLFESPV